MPSNSNVQAITFSNTKIRPFADLLYTAYLSAKSLVSMWNAQNVPAALPNDANVLADGAATDGRAPITDAQATNIINRAQDLINWMEGSTAIAAGDGSKIVLTTVSAVEVNGKSLF
jgi:hypothetical protein